MRLLARLSAVAVLAGLMARYTVQSRHQGITYTVGTDRLEEVLQLVRMRLEDGHETITIQTRKPDAPE